MAIRFGGALVACDLGLLAFEIIVFARTELAGTPTFLNTLLLPGAARIDVGCGTVGESRRARHQHDSTGEHDAIDEAVHGIYLSVRVCVRV